MKKETLSKKEVALIDEKKKEWINFAFYSGDELDIDAFQKGITWAYEKTKLKDPIKVYVDSPLGLQYACQILKKIDFNNIKSGQVSDQVSDQVYGQVRDQVSGQVRGQVRGQVYGQVSDQVRGQVRDQVSGQVRDQVRGQVRDQVYGQVRDQVYGQVSGQVSDQVSDQVRDQVSGQVRGQVRDQYEQFDWIGVGWDSGGNAFYDYFEEIGIKVTEDYRKYREFIKSGVWDTILFNNFAIGCRRPNFISRDEENRMSNDQRSAISWRDGYEQFYLDGVFFTKELWKKVISQKMSFKEIMAIEISDQRTVALKYNPQAILNENSVLVHKDNRNNELYKIENQQLNTDLGFNKIWFLKMLCPTGRVFIEGVPPEEAEKNPNATAMQALLCGLSLSEYLSMELES